MMKILRLFKASYRKDYLILKSYRFSMIGEFFLATISIIFIIFFSRLVSVEENIFLERYDNNYFLFLLSGTTSILFLSQTYTSIPLAISQALSLGYFEKMISTKISLHWILISSLTLPMMRGLIRVVLIFALAFFFSKENFTGISFIEFIFLLIITSMPFLGISLIFASLIVYFKKANFINSLFLMGCTAFSGVIYPIDVMPKFFQFISYLFPTTFSLKVIRSRLIEENSYFELTPDLTIIFLISLFSFFMGIFSINLSLKLSKLRGNLSHY